MAENKKNKKISDAAYVLKGICKMLFKLRGLILGIPVAVAAVVMAIYNQIHLPDLVGISLQASGEYARMVSKEMAVLGPLALTGICIVLIFCSKKVLYPWLISLFSLALPLLILFTNSFTG